MNCRSLAAHELPELLRLYAFLHPDDPVLNSKDPAVAALWEGIQADRNLHYYIAQEGPRTVATCTLTVIPNLTRSARPYGLIENVVTDPDFRRKGFATAVLHHALDEAWRAGCYKVMLETGRQDEATLRFYEGAGFQRGIKTAFIAYPA